MKEQSLEVIKNAILIMAIARVLGEAPLTRSVLVLAALPVVVAALMVYLFYLRLPYPSPYGHGRKLLESGSVARTHFRDMIAMRVIGLGAGAFTSTLLALF